jgi:hypothetical protein
MHISSQIAALGCGAPRRFCISALKCQQGNEGCQKINMDKQDRQDRQDKKAELLLFYVFYPVHPVHPVHP